MVVLSNKKGESPTPVPKNKFLGINSKPARIVIERLETLRISWLTFANKKAEIKKPIKLMNPSKMGLCIIFALKKNNVEIRNAKITAVE